MVGRCLAEESMAERWAFLYPDQARDEKAISQQILLNAVKRLRNGESVPFRELLKAITTENRINSLEMKHREKMGY